MRRYEINTTRARCLVKRYGSPLLVLDRARVREQYLNLSAALTGVELYYAIKALPHAQVISELAAQGAYFDIASSGEIELLRRQGIAAQRTLHTHPIKRESDIRAALRYGCNTFVVDNAEELEKFSRFRYQASVLLRVGFRSGDAVVDLAKKFGCAPGEALALLARAKHLDLHVKGLSFHVGSQCASPLAHAKAIGACAELMRIAGETGLAQLTILDIGGGFPVNYGADDADDTAIMAFCQPIRAALDDLPDHIQVIAEPGRFLVAPAMTCITSVIGKAQREGRWWYYLDDGVYGSFSGQVYDHACYPLEPVSADDSTRLPSALAGPTCDSIDVLREDIRLPALGIGDVLIWRMMGAYTAASAGEFNSLPKTPILVAHNADILRHAA